MRVEPESDELVITSNVVVHPSRMTLEERKAELSNLIQVQSLFESESLSHAK